MCYVTSALVPWFRQRIPGGQFPSATLSPQHFPTVSELFLTLMALNSCRFWFLSKLTQSLFKSSLPPLHDDWEVSPTFATFQIWSSPLRNAEHQIWTHNMENHGNIGVFNQSDSLVIRVAIYQRTSVTVTTDCRAEQWINNIYRKTHRININNQ